MPIRIASLMMIALACSGCTAWPVDGLGGYAERRPALDSRIFERSQRFEMQRQRGADQFAAGLVHETRTQFVRVQRNSWAGMNDDVALDLHHLDHLLQAIEARLAKKP